MDNNGSDDGWDNTPAATDGFGLLNKSAGTVRKQLDDGDWGPVVPAATEEDWGLNTPATNGGDDDLNAGAGGFLGGFGRIASTRGRAGGTLGYKNNGFEETGGGFEGGASSGFGSVNDDFASGDSSGRSGGFRGRGAGTFASRSCGFARNDDGFGSSDIIGRSTGFRGIESGSFSSRNSGGGGSGFRNDESGFGGESGFGEGATSFRGGSIRGRGDRFKSSAFRGGNTGFCGGDNSLGNGASTGRSNGFRGRVGSRGGGLSGKGSRGGGFSGTRGSDFAGGLGGSSESSGFCGFRSSKTDRYDADNNSGGFGSGTTSGLGSDSSRFRRGYGRSAERGSSLCYNCGEGGHHSRDCTNSKKPQSSQERPHRCFNCNQEGHRSSECSVPKSSACYNCGAEDHISRECPNPPKPRKIEKEDIPKKPPSTFVPKDEDVEVLFKDHIEQGEMFTKLFETEVTLTEGGLHGRSERSKRITSFDELELTEQLAKNVVNAGYKHPTPIQQYAMPAIFKGRDIMACAQTGSGKTAAFLLPVMTTLMRTENLSSSAESTCCPRCLIIAPTRELAVQIYNEGRKFAYKTVLHVSCCYGGTSVMAQRQALRGATILVATVGRLKHFISEGYISLREIKYLILDEADRMLDLGFEASLNFILNHPSLTAKEERQIFMFSATFPPDVQAIASQQLKHDFLMITIGKIGVANKCITQEIIECTSVADKKEKFFELLNIDLKNYEIHKEADVFKKKTMVFVSRKVFADTLGVLLSECGIPSTTIHGDRVQNQRAEAINDFKYGRKPVLIATAVGERGLDIKGVDHVINYDLPTNAQDYVHRIGRTGRVGNPGRATSLYLSEENRELAQSLVEILTDSEQEVPEFLANDAKGCSRFSGFGGFGGGGDANDAVEEEDWD